MHTETFVASRWTTGNHLFPTKIVVGENTVSRHKRSWFSENVETVHVSNVATVNITTGILWSKIRIESTGGSDPLESHGHTKTDAQRIQALIVELQTRAGSARPR